MRRPSALAFPFLLPLLLLLLALALAAVPASGSVPFYLSAERVFLPGEEATVQFQAGAEGEVRFVLYRIDDATDFFLDQKDIHRPAVEGTPLRRALDAAIAAAPDGPKPPLYAADPTPPPEGEAPRVRYLRTWLEKVPAGGWQVRPVATGAQDPGLYLVEAVSGNQVAYTTVGITALAVVTKRAPGKLLAFAVDRRTGAPLAGVTVRACRGGEPVLAGATGDDGLLVADAPADPGLVIVAEHGADWAVDDPVYFPATAPHLKAYLYTDRPVYRPGETVAWKGILRAWDGTALALPDVDAAEVAATDARGGALWNGKADVNTWGSLAGRFPLPATCALGTARLSVTVGGKSYTGEFGIEEYRRPEIAVLVRPDRAIVPAGEKAAVAIEASYYAGGPVAGARAVGTVRRSRFARSPWADADAAWYQTAAEAAAVAPETLSTHEVALDAAGRATLEVGTAKADEEMVYTVTVEVTDAARSTAQGSGALRAVPAAFRLEVATDKFLYPVEDNARVTVRALDPLDRPVAVPVTVTLALRAGEAPQPVATFTGATGAAGTWTFECPMTRRGLNAFTAKAADERGNAVSAEKLVWVASGEVPLSYRGDWITLLPDRAAYAPGDTARVLALFPFAAAHPLVTLEGDRLHSYAVLALKDNARVLELPVRAEHAPNVFVSVSCVHGNEFLSATRVLLVPPRQQFLKVEVSAKKPAFRPREEAELAVRVRDADGRPVAAEVSVGLVDAAIYALHPERTVPIAAFFYPIRRNSVGTGSSVYTKFYGQAQATKRIPAPAEPPAAGDKGHSGQGGGPTTGFAPADGDTSVPAGAPSPPEAPAPGPVADPAQAPGKRGGAKDEAAPAPVRQDFRATAFWDPQLTTDDAGRATFRVTFPDDLTTWRFTARAVTVETQVGEAVSRVATAQPIRAQLGAPRFLTERDAVSIALTGHNGLPEPAAMTLALKAEGAARANPPPTATAEVGAGQTFTYEWGLEAGAPGTATLEASALTPAASDAVRTALPVLRHGVLQSAAFAWKVGDAPETFTLELPAAADPQSAALTIAFAPTTVAAVAAALDYLADYPYGCTEQTLSRFLPDLAAARVLQGLGAHHPRLEKDLPDMVAKGLERLAHLQHEDGGWGWWSNDATDPAMTAYVVRGLLLAKSVGAPVGEAMLARGLDRLTALLAGAPLDYPTRALVLYDLARAGADCRAELDRTFDARERLQAAPQVRALLALALLAGGRKPEAEAAAAELEKSARVQDDGVYWGESTASRWQTDAVESTAWALSALVAIKPAAEVIPRAVDWLLLQREGDHWKSTRDTAVAALALLDVAQAQPAAALECELGVKVNGVQLKPVKMTRDALTGDGLSVRIVAHRLRAGANEVTLTRSGGPGVYYNAVLSWVTAEEDLKPAAAGLEVAREYLLLVKDPDGKGWRTAPLPEALPRGARVLVRTTVKSDAARDYVVVEDPLPATARVITGEDELEIVGVEERLKPVQREVRDDRVVSFLDRLPAGTATLAYVFEAAYPGRFHALPAAAQLMYFPRVRGTSAERRITVK